MNGYKAHCIPQSQKRTHDDGCRTTDRDFSHLWKISRYIDVRSIRRQLGWAADIDVRWRGRLTIMRLIIRNLHESQQ